MSTPPAEWAIQEGLSLRMILNEERIGSILTLSAADSMCDEQS